MKSKRFKGVCVLSTFLLSLSITTATVMEYYKDPLNEALGTTSSKIVTESTDDENEIWNYQSNFTTAEEAYNGYRDLALKEGQETCALLKNENYSLPIESDSKITMMGLRSYAPVYGNSGGSTPDKATIDDGNTITELFEDAGFELNPSMLSTYEDYCNDLTWGSQGYGATAPQYVELTTTSDIPELSPTELSTINPNYKADYDEYDDAAIVVVGRPGGESKNYYLGEEGLDSGVETTTGNIMGLSTEEKAIIEEAEDNFDNVIVLLNTVNTMEFSDLVNDDEIDSIMWIGYPGSYGFTGVAENLNGTVSPSAHLGDTLVANNAASPALQSFGDIGWENADEFSSDCNVNSYLVEAEDIYSGYRYYETRYYDIVNGVSGSAVASAGTYTNTDGTISTEDGIWNYENEVTYPFGQGLSYTTFTQTITGFSVLGNKKSADVTVEVKNDGDFAGKSVIQLYGQAPYIEGGIEKSAVQLLNYEKTNMLEAGETQEITLTVDMANISSYDYEDAETFVLDEGDYYFALGDNAHDAINNILAKQGKTIFDGMDSDGDSSKVRLWNNSKYDADTFSVSEEGTEITNQLSDGDYSMDLNSFMGEDTVTYLSRTDWDGTFPESYAGLSADTDQLKELLSCDFVELSDDDDTSEYEWGVDNGLTLNDLKGADWDDNRWEDLVDEVTIDEFLDFASHAFHNIQAIDSVGYLGDDADDGPGGSDSNTFSSGTYRGEAFADADGEYGDLGTRVTPSEQNLAYSWNKELAFENGEIVLGETSLIFNCPIMIGPAMNIHRHGMNGRGGEYYSEDPILSGYTGSNKVQGAQSKGCLVNIKHAAFNDQEINRSGISVFMNEQKARELELRNLRQAFTAKGKPASFKNSAEYDDTFVNGAYGVMSSYNRVGAVASSANAGLMQNIIRDEWGFKGYNVTDFTGVSLKASPKESILAGTTAFCGFGSPSLDYWDAEVLAKDADMCKAIKTNIKYVLYSLTQSNALNGINSTSYTVQLVTSWRIGYAVAISVSGLVTLGSLIAYGLLEFKKKDKNKTEVKEEK